jgi:hypothetical protein
VVRVVLLLCVPVLVARTPEAIEYPLAYAVEEWPLPSEAAAEAALAPESLSQPLSQGGLLP